MENQKEIKGSNEIIEPDFINNPNPTGDAIVSLRNSAPSLSADRQIAIWERIQSATRNRPNVIELFPAGTEGSDGEEGEQQEF